MNTLPDFSCQGYQVIRELGHNYFGGRVTYLATNTNQHSVVIKQFQFATFNSDWSDFKAYEREIQVLQGLNHHGIPRYLDAFETPNGFCMVQEYKNAQSLAVTRSFDPDEIKRIAVSLLEILIYLQNRIPPVIHRDIKPENILVDEQLNVYLIDFGLARIGGGEVAQSSVVAGTFGFMPPEQLYNRQLTEATDLYGLGATLICLLTTTKSTAIETLIDDNRINFKSLVPKLSLRFINWLEKMVQPNPKNRYANAATALKVLKSTYIIRLPEVKLSKYNLEFKATKLGEKLTQLITISNSIPDTELEGRLEVAPHPNDPPHTPDSHAWISLSSKRFARNQVKHLITVDTSNLLADKTYRREVLLHTNSFPETRAIGITVQTASIPIEIQKLPYSDILWLFLYSFYIPWDFKYIVSWDPSTFLVMIVLSLLVVLTSTVVNKNRKLFMYVRIVYFFSVIVFSWKGIYNGIVEWRLLSVGFFVLATGVTAEAVAEKAEERKFRKSYIVALSLLTIASGISLEIGWTSEFLNPFIISAILATILPLATIIFYPNWQRARLIAKYRKSEQNLIQP